MNIYNQIAHYGYFIKNGFICTPDEYYGSMKKYKSYNDLSICDNIDIHSLNRELKKKYTPTIENYSNNLYLYFIKNIFSYIEIEANLLLINKLECREINKKILNDKLIMAKDEYSILEKIRNIFINKNIQKKYKEIKIIKNKILDSKNKYNSTCIEFVEWIENQLSIIDNNILNNTNIKTKLNDLVKINKRYNFINDNQIKPYLQSITDDIKNIKNKIKYMNETFKDYEKIIDIQLYHIKNDYKLKIFDIIKNNWNDILKSKNLQLNINDKITIGNSKWGSSIMNIELSKLYEFKLI